jgi:hypothetical protein
MWDTEEQRLAQLRKILTPAQTARLIVVLPAMERKIQNQLRKAVLRQRPPRRQAQSPDPIDPWDGVDPFPEPPPPPPRPVPKAKSAKQSEPVCDPYSAFHGCPK